ncbi:hypothetical protein SDC9_172928 [bioreactor metagenome]|uniref:Uncharacterized protein n=1 Tax=bioreactor metagenome TaxID=1076179 RepID=A0A645GH60_9ZZZZ
MVATVAVQDVDGVDLVEIVLQGVGGEHAGDAGVEAGAQKGGEARLLEPVLIGPLPAVIKIGGEAQRLAALLVNRPPGGIVGVLRLVVGGVDIVHAGGQAGVHDGQVLIGQGHVQDGVRPIRADEGGEGRDIHGVHLGGGDLGGGLAGKLLLKRVTLGDRAAGDAQVGEYLAVLAALLNGDGRHAAAADDKQS